MANYMSYLPDDTFQNIAKFHDRFDVTKYLHRMNNFPYTPHFFYDDSQRVDEVLNGLKKLFTPLTGFLELHKTRTYYGQDYIRVKYTLMNRDGPSTGNWMDRVLMLWDLTEIKNSFLNRIGVSHGRNAPLDWNTPIGWVGEKFPFELQNVICRLPVRNVLESIRNCDWTHIWNPMDRFNPEIKTWKGQNFEELLYQLKTYNLTIPERGMNLGVYLQHGIKDWTTFKSDYKGALQYVIQLMIQLKEYTVGDPTAQPSTIQQKIFQEFSHRKIHGQSYEVFLNNLIAESERDILELDANFQKLDDIFTTYKKNDFMYMFSKNTAGRLLPESLQEAEEPEPDLYMPDLSQPSHQVQHTDQDLLGQLFEIS